MTEMDAEHCRNSWNRRLFLEINISWSLRSEVSKHRVRRPLSVCVDASDWSGYTGGIKTTCGKSTDHCVQLVGYGSHKGTDYWKVKRKRMSRVWRPFFRVRAACMSQVATGAAAFGITVRFEGLP